MRLTYRGKSLGFPLTALLCMTMTIVVFWVPVLFRNEAAANDEKTLISSYPYASSCVIGRGSFAAQQGFVCSALILKSVGANAFNAPYLGGIVSVLLTLIPIIKFRRIPAGVFFVCLCWGFIRGSFLSVLSKDLISSLVVILAMLGEPYVGVGFSWSVPALIYGWIIRKYWILVVFLWYALIPLKKLMSFLNILIGIILFYFIMAFIFKILMGQSLDFARQLVNGDREVGSEGAKTVILPVISSSNIFAETLDAVITLLRLAFPFETLRSPSVPKIGFVLVMPVTLWWLVRQILTAVGDQSQNVSKAAQIALVPFAFFVIQGIFEPDFGSFARHFSIMSPLIFFSMAVSSRLSDNSAG